VIVRSVSRKPLQGLHFFNGPESRTLGKMLAGSLATMLLAGCAIHPAQQDVTHVKTQDLVSYIRCETRFAIQDESIRLLEERDRSSPALPVLREWRARGDIWPANVRALLVGQERTVYDEYIKTGIAYDFSFDITEDDGASAAADPIKLFTNGIAGVGLSASGDYKRENLRHFIVSETAQDLLENPRLLCPSDYKDSNYAYPISGKIGIDELISTFFDLNESKKLAENKSVSSSGATSDSTVFADSLTFTTTVMGSVSPHVIVTPTGNRWGLASAASLGASGQRIDKHGLIIGLSLDEPKGRAAKPAVATAALIPGGVGKSALQRSYVRSYTEQSALDAVQQARVDAYLDRAVH
jgi:hypothetical protein